MSIQLADIPLGPLGSVDISLWRTETGSDWHGDRSCGKLKKNAVEERFPQPSVGTLKDINFPAKLHCEPVEPHFGYVKDARALVQFSNETSEAKDELGLGDIPIRLFAFPLDSVERGEECVRRLEAQAGTSELTHLWRTEMRARVALRKDVARRLDPSLTRMAVMTVAAWVLSGRTPREHQAHYEFFLMGALGIFKIEFGSDFSEMRARQYLNGHVLRDWLSAVAAGGLPERVTKAMVDGELERGGPDLAPGGTMTDALRKVGASWQRELEAVALSHPSDVVAIFHQFTPGHHDRLVDLYLGASGGAKIQVGQLDWVVSRVPASFRLFLARRDEGLAGLVLVDGQTHGMSAEWCALFLKNLLIDLDFPLAAPHVRTYSALAPTFLEPSDSRAEISDIELPKSDFSPIGGVARAGIGLGVTLVECARPLRAARMGHEIPVPARETTRGRKKG